MDAAAFCGAGALAARAADFAREDLDGAGVATLSDADLANVNGTPLDAAQQEAHRLRALLYSIRPELVVSKGDAFELMFQSVAMLREQDWETVKSRLRNELGLSLGECKAIGAKVHPAAADPAGAAYPGVDVKQEGGEGRTASAKTSKPRRKKDKNAPKRPRNAYLVFLDRRRPAMQAAHPHAAMKELTREMAKEWQNLDDAEKAECDRIALINKAAYEEAVKAYQEQTQGAAAGGAAAPALSVDPAAMAGL